MPHKQDWIEERDGGVIIRLMIQPNASRSEVVGLHNGRLKIRVAAPPVDGEANAELLQFLKKQLKLTNRDLVIVRGEASKSKDVSCANTSIEKVKALWPAERA